MVALLDRFGARPTADHARSLLDLGAALASRGEADTGPGNASRAWLRAGVLRALGDHGAAAAAAADAHAGTRDARALRALFCARELAKVPDRQAAWRHLAEAASEADDLPTLLSVDQVRTRLARDGAPPSDRRLRVAVLGAVTLDLVASALRAAALARGIDVDLHVGGFDQYAQEIAGPSVELNAFAPQAVVLLLDARSLGLPDESAAPGEWMAAEVERLRSLWHRAAERWGCIVLQTTYAPPTTDPYGSLAASLAGGRRRLVRALDLALAQAARAEDGVHLVDAERLAALAGADAWEDPAAWHSSRTSPGPRAVPVLAHEVASMLQAATGLSAKCLALDLDDTLWGGAVGDLGVEGITLGGTGAGEAFVAFQRYVRGLASRGIAVAVCSNNDADAARAPFREHPEMALRESDVACFAADWRPKEEKLVAIANTLNIGLDAIAFADDNPLERERIRATLPRVRVIELPADPAGFAAAVDRSGVFEALALTDEDRARTSAYRSEAKRSAEVAGAADVDELIRSLDMTARVGPFRDVDVGRIHQLTNKTNQFNLTTLRMSEAEIRSLMDDAEVETRSLRLADRFGDNGLVALLIARVDGGALRIVQWLMSCRVFGRRVEDVMIGEIAESALARGLTDLEGEYRPTPKNSRFADLYERLGFDAVERRGDGSVAYRADAGRIAGRPRPAIAVEVARAEAVRGAR